MGASVLIRGARAAQKKHANFVGTDGAKIKTFLDAYSDAGIIHAHQKTAVVIAASVAQATANLDVTANIHYRNATNDSVGRFQISAPKESAVLTELTDAGERVTQAAGEAIVSAWRTANDITDTLTFEYGTITEKP